MQLTVKKNLTILLLGLISASVYCFWIYQQIIGQREVAFEIGCERTLTFQFDNLYGFGSELNLVTNAIAYGIETNRQIFINDTGWNYGTLSDYFKYSFQHNCQRVGYEYLQEGDTKDFESWENVTHLLLSRTQFVPLHNWAYKNSHKAKGRSLELFEPFFRVKNKAIFYFWNLNQELRQLFLKKEREMKKLFGPSNSFMGIYLRAGDKLDELRRFNISNESVPMIDYLRAIENQQEKDNLTKTELRVLVTSDDLFVPVQVKRERPDWLVFSPFNPDLNESVRGGHDMYRFNHKTSLQRRIEMTRQLVVEMELQRGASYLVCTYSSNICRLIALLRGWETAHQVESLDIDWFPT